MGDQGTIQAELKKIRQKFDALESDFQKLRNLSKEEFKTSSLKEGTVINVASHSLSILKYICKTSNVNVEPKAKSKGEPSTQESGLSDYIYHAHTKKKITDRVRSEFENIRNIRNRCAHPDDEDSLSESHEEISTSKIESVNESMTYIVDWFFETYLKNAYPEFSTKVPETLNPEKEYKKEESVSGNNKSIQSAAKETITESHSKSKSKKILILSICFIVLAIGLYSLKGTLWANESDTNSNAVTSGNSSVTTTSANAPAKNEKQKVYQLISNYYEALYDSSGNINYSDYFADNITEWKRLEDTGTYKGIDIEELASKYKKDFNQINAEFNLNPNNLELANDEGKWIYMDKLSAFKADEIGGSKRKLTIEITINDQNKISGLKEIIEEAAGGS